MLVVPMPYTEAVDNGNHFRSVRCIHHLFTDTERQTPEDRNAERETEKYSNGQRFKEQ